MPAGKRAPECSTGSSACWQGAAVRAEAHGQVAVGRAVGPGGAHLRKKLSPRCRMIMVAASTPCCAWFALLRWSSAQRRPARGKGVSDRQHAEEASATDRCRAGVLTRARVCGRATQGTSAQGSAALKGQPDRLGFNLRVPPSTVLIEQAIFDNLGLRQES